MSLLRQLYLKTRIEYLPPDSWLFRFKKKIAKVRRWIKFQFNYARKNKFAHTCCIDGLASDHKQESYDILLLKLDHIGDFLTGLDALSIIRNAFPAAHITFICLPSVKTLAEASQLFDEVIAFDATPESVDLGRTQHMLAKLAIAKFKTLVDQHYWLAADLRHDADTRKFLHCINAEHKAGFRGHDDTPLTICLPNMEWDVNFQELNHRSLPIYNATRLKLLAVAIVDTLKNEIDLGTHTDAFPLVAVAETFRELTLVATEIKIGLCLGAGAELKTWLVNYWCQLLSAIMQDYRVKFIFFGGPGDRALTQPLLDTLPSDRVIDLIGAVPLTQTAAYLKHIDIYIGCDTGMTHFAAGLGIPTLSLFSGVSGLSIWQARGRKVKTLYVDVPCSPCHLRFYSDCINQHLCMKKLTPDFVFGHFRTMLTTILSDRQTVASR